MTADFSMPHCSSRPLRSTPVDVLIAKLRKFQEDESGVRASYPWASRFVMGYPLPAWQREAVWSDAQAIRFLQSMWSGVHLGTYMLNDNLEDGWYVADEHVVARANMDVVLDGQQRLHAIERYITGQIPALDSQGIPRYYRELDTVQRRRFGHIVFAYEAVGEPDEQALRQIYDLRNFGGTPHLQSERALPSLNPGADPVTRDAMRWRTARDLVDAEDLLSVYAGRLGVDPVLSRQADEIIDRIIEERAGSRPGPTPKI